jgi:hypothetical protein
MEPDRNSLRKYCILRNVTFRLTTEDVRKLTYVFLKANPHLNNPFSKLLARDGTNNFLKDILNLVYNSHMASPMLIVKTLIRKTFTVSDIL